MNALNEDTPDEAFERFRGRFQAALFGSIDDHLERLNWDQTRIEAHQRERLRAMLAVATEHSPFHARRLSGIDPTTFELADLPRLPVMTKTEMMGHFDEVSTDRRLTLAAADEAVSATGTIPRPIAGELTVLASGGSSGTRGIFAFDAAAFAEYAATLIRPAMARRGAAVGSERGGPTVIVAAASAIHATSAGPAMLSGSPLAFVPVPVTQAVDDIVARLNELQPAVLYGYPSMLAVLAAEQVAGRLHIAPTAVTANSEELRESHRVAIVDAFGVPAANSYGSSEGLVGSSAPGERTMTFASDCCIVELVDEHDAPVPPGTTSAAVLVTNLFNTAQPLIRYRLEDRFTRRPDAGDHGHLRADVEGRSSNVFDYGAVTVHPLVIATPLTAHPHVLDYQVRQTDHGVTVDVVTAAAIDSSQLATDLAAALAGVGLTDPTVDVRVVSGLARDSRTGKLAQFVPASRRPEAGTQRAHARR